MFFNKYLITIVVTLIFSIIFIVWIKEDNEDNIEKNKPFILKKNNEFNEEKPLIDRTENKINSSSPESNLFFFYKNLKNIGWNGVADKFISGEINHLGLTKDEIQDICDRTLVMVKHKIMEDLFYSGCHPLKARNSFYSININNLDEHGAVDQKDIIAKLNLYKKYGYLNTDITYETPSKDYKETTSLYDRAVSFGLNDVVKYFEDSGITSKSDINLINIQLNGYPNIETIKFLESKGYSFDSKTVEIVKNTDLEAKNYDVYVYVVGKLK